MRACHACSHPATAVNETYFTLALVDAADKQLHVRHVQLPHPDGLVLQTSITTILRWMTGFGMKYGNGFELEVVLNTNVVYEVKEGER